ncbi:C-type lectin mosGCTL-7-like [Haematobia irritans]|uniref:C-type lectin mosGCTL-7-like n=1 Tax=Haematobia irritans TaxID=7368 RepID=UPI003F50370C
MSLTWKTFILFGVLALTNRNALAVGEDDEYVGVPPKDIVITPRSAGVTKILGDKQYYIETYDKMDWHQASVACIQKGMTLASIESEKENKLLKRLLNDYDLLDKKYWTSGSTLANANEYVWMDSGKKVVYTNWNAGPAPAANKCIQTNESFKWVEQTCNQADQKSYFICSKPLIPSCGPRGACRFVYRPF